MGVRLSIKTHSTSLSLKDDGHSTSADQHLRRIRLNNRLPAKNIVVLGAGMAGLVAAYELQKLGHRVSVFEASDRVGGRVHTKRFRSGQYHEFGAMRIPASHDYTRHYVNEMGLQLRRFVTSNRDTDALYHIRGRVSTIANAKDILPSYRLSPSERSIAAGSVAPAIFGHYVEQVLESLTYDDAQSLFGYQALTPRAEELERQTLGEFLERNVQGPDTRELIGAVTGLEVWWDRALSMFIRDELVETGVGLEEIVGGMDLLPSAVKTRLNPDTIQYNTQILSIERRDPKVRIRLQHGDAAPTTLDCDHVICTIPFSVLRQMELSGLGVLKQRAIRNLSYASSTKVLFECGERFWETRYNIVGGASLSDGISRATYYPSDNAAPISSESKSREQSQQGKSLYTCKPITNNATKAGVNDWDVSHGPGALVGSYNWGVDARRLGAMNKDERADAVSQVIANFHPEIHAFIRDHDSVFWDEQRWASGAFCFMQPGDLRNYYHDAIRAEGNLHFAGEHTSLEQGWIQGALMSSLRAVEEITSQ